MSDTTVDAATSVAVNTSSSFLSDAVDAITNPFSGNYNSPTQSVVLGAVTAFLGWTFGLSRGYSRGAAGEQPTTVLGIKVA